MMSSQKLIDANKLKEAIENIDWYHVNSQGKLTLGANSELHIPLYKADDIYKVLENAITVAEIVRCKDCKYRGHRTCPMVHIDSYYDEDDGWDDVWDDETHDDGFCDLGTRVNEDETD